MEDMARIAVVEQSIKDEFSFMTILNELLMHLRQILEKPNDYELRIIKSNILKETMKHDAFTDYLKYIGFKRLDNDFTYPKELPLSNLKIAQDAVARKMTICRAPLPKKWSITEPRGPKFKSILELKNDFVHKIKHMVRFVLVYEDKELQLFTRGIIPIESLRLLALQRMREHQKMLKKGEIVGEDMPFGLALLMTVMDWFKNEFFTWVTQPNCKACNGPTEFHYTTSVTTETETYNLEMYQCKQCGDKGGAEFPRFNNPRTLLTSRRGRCGEWANCFALICRSLGYDTRYVMDVTDHVWCEIFDYDSSRWLHLDPCENKLDCPLLYEHGWRKQLSYVIAFSKDDVQDVTWRYTSNHKEVLKRRKLLKEEELLELLMTLRGMRQARLSETRRRYLAKRTLRELAELMVEKKPGDNECQGRISGSDRWKRARGELGTRKEHTFELKTVGEYVIMYNSSDDQYVIKHKFFGVLLGTKKMKHWYAGAHRIENVFRNVENDWKQIYLAREEGKETGLISWKLSLKSKDLIFDNLHLTAASTVFESGLVEFTIKFDDENPVDAEVGAKPNEEPKIDKVFKRKFRKVELIAKLSGGEGGVAWQHAQLFRTMFNTPQGGLVMRTSVAGTASSSSSSSSSSRTKVTPSSSQQP